MPFIIVSLPLNNRSPALSFAFPIRIFLLPVLLGKSIYNPAVAGIVKGVVVEIAKSVPGSVLIYLRVPFCNVNQLSVRVAKVPPISNVSVVACEFPLLTVILLKVVEGVELSNGSFVIEAELLPKKMTSQTFAPNLNLTLLPAHGGP